MKTQQVENGFDPIKLISALNTNSIRYILIGRQAVVQYGASLFSFDYDFWIHSDDRDKTYLIIYSFGLESKYKPNENQPIDIFTDDEGNKVDVFFVKTMKNENKGLNLLFDDVYNRSIINKDNKSTFFVRIPSIDDLIALKQIGDIKPKDEEDVEYLNIIRSLMK